MKYVVPVVLVCALGGCSMFSSSPKTDPTQQQVAAHEDVAPTAPAPPDKGHGPVASKGCDAADSSGVVFTDSNATVKTMTNKHMTQEVCRGHLPDGATLPGKEVSFKSGDGKTSLTCLDSWRETIGVDGGFTKVCRTKEAKKPPRR